MSRSDLIPPSPSFDEYSVDYKETHAAHQSEIEVAEPFSLFGAWLDEARQKEINDPNAMALATVDESGLPDVRMVLLKDFDTQGFVFYSNTTSTKGQQLGQTPKAALLFHWKSLRRQVRLRGQVVRVSEAEADEYFQSRARQSQIGAWASDQSHVLESRFALEKRVADYALKFGLSKIERPKHWTGFKVVPESFEFWRDMPFRLHDRLKFERAADDKASVWTKSKLYP
jgi:pyridoxamine 5'-phosphate oxidase